MTVYSPLLITVPPNLTSFTIGTKDLSSHDQHGSYDQHQYNQQPQYGQHQSYGGSPPSNAPTTTAGPTLPPGWTAQWDQNSQRWYYLEQATGRTQWDLPQPSQAGYPPSGAPHGSFAPGPPIGGHGYDGHGQQGAQGGYYSQETKHVHEDSHGGGHKEIVEKKKKEEKSSGKGGMLAAGAGGLAVGAVGGAMVGHAMGAYSLSPLLPLLNLLSLTLFPFALSYPSFMTSHSCTGTKPPNHVLTSNNYRRRLLRRRPRRLRTATQLRTATKLRPTTRLSPSAATSILRRARSGTPSAR